MSTRGERLGMAMKARGLRKQMALAHIIGVNESSISRWLNDGPMSVDNAISICNYLNVSLDWLLTGKDIADHQRRIDRVARDRDVDLTEAFQQVVDWMTDAMKAHLLTFLKSVPSE